MSTPAPAARKPRIDVLKTIAIYKMLKVMLLLAIAYGEIRLRDASLTAKILNWASARPTGMEQHMVTQLLAWFTGLSTSNIHKLRILTLSYACVFAVEGVGLWMEQRWAEWMTTIVTASLIPFELWELVYRPNIGKVLVLLANVAIVGYLIWHVRNHSPLRAKPLGE